MPITALLFYYPAVHLLYTLVSRRPRRKSGARRQKMEQPFSSNHVEAHAFSDVKCLPILKERCGRSALPIMIPPNHQGAWRLVGSKGPMTSVASVIASSP
jgi:hypothetical protein